MYSELPASTRVWVYQSNKAFEEAQLPQIKVYIDQFVRNWVSHNQALRAHGDVLHNRFIVLMVDESQAGASGCSIDKSVNFLKALQNEYKVDLFDRMIFSYQEKDQIHSVDNLTFAKLYAEGTITDETLVVDTLVKNKGEFETGFLKPLAQSWHKRMV